MIFIVRRSRLYLNTTVALTLSLFSKEMQQHATLSYFGTRKMRSLTWSITKRWNCEQNMSANLDNIIIVRCELKCQTCYRWCTTFGVRSLLRCCFTYSAHWPLNADVEDLPLHRSRHCAKTFRILMFDSSGHGHRTVRLERGSYCCVQNGKHRCWRFCCPPEYFRNGPSTMLHSSARKFPTESVKWKSRPFNVVFNKRCRC